MKTAQFPQTETERLSPDCKSDSQIAIRRPDVFFNISAKQEVRVAVGDAGRGIERGGNLQKQKKTLFLREEATPHQEAAPLYLLKEGAT